MEEKPFSVSGDGTAYYEQPEGSSYAKKLGLREVMVWRQVSPNGVEKYVVKDYNETLHITQDLSSVGIFLEQLADRQRGC